MSDYPIVHIELSAQDPKTMADFYTSLFGWKMEFDERFDYMQFQPGSGPGGAFTKIDNELYKPGDIVIYVGTDDIDATLRKVESLGGKTLLPKTEIPETGWFALFSDPSGNRIGLYTSMRPPVS